MPFPDLARAGLSALVALVAALVATRLVISLATAGRVLDQPLGYKAHEAPTPLLGGIAVAIAATVAALACLPTGPQVDIAAIAALAVGGVVILVAGLVDDINGLRPSQKFAWQVGATVAAGVVLAILGVRVDLFLSGAAVPLAWVVTIVWIVAITNAVNFLDNMNGLCAGLGAIGGVALAGVNLQFGDDTVAVLSAALAGACLGFVPYNYPQARIFLGDTGSMFIGFSLAALSIMGVYTRGAQIPAVAVFVPLLVLAIPLIDLTLVVIIRIWAGHPISQGDRRHISHRLVRRGLPPSRAVAVLWLAAALCSLGALLLPTMQLGQAALLAPLLLCALVALVTFAGRRGLDDD